jgi:hypothetical protein
LQELVIGKLVEGKNGMHNANVLGLVMSVIFVAMMCIITIQVKKAQKNYVSG